MNGLDLDEFLTHGRPPPRVSGRPASGYQSTNGEPIPSVTQILARFQDSALMRWAWKKGSEGEPISGPAPFSEDNKGDPAALLRAVAGLPDHILEGAHLGTVAHAYVQARLEGLRAPFSAVRRRSDVGPSVQAFDAWWRREGPSIEVVALEVPMVSDRLGLGGTVDAVLRRNGDLVVADWKTSKRAYTEHLIQLGAYSLLWRETRGERVDAGLVLRLPKDGTPAEEVPVSGEEMRVARKVFANLVEAYHLCEELERALPDNRT